MTRGLFAGDDAECYHRGAELCRAVNLDVLDRVPAKMVVYLDPQEYKSTWLGNKAVYRTRMAIADGGELVILAPGVRQFGEDAAIDRLIRRFGYRGTRGDRSRRSMRSPTCREPLRRRPPDPRLIRRPVPHHLLPRPVSTRAEVEGVGYEYAALQPMIEPLPARPPPAGLESHRRRGGLLRPEPRPRPVGHGGAIRGMREALPAVGGHY